jgi:hypothetical protein
MSFKRTIENFACAHCGADVVGNGYTDHCSQCLWGKHVDNTPGDRARTCLGMLEPKTIEGTVARYRIRYRCTRCGECKVNDTAENDNPEALIALARARKL